MPQPLMNIFHDLYISRSASGAWLRALETVVECGAPIAPRAKPCREILHATSVLPMAQPVVTIAERKLAYSFAAAEALAILAGDARVTALAPYAPRIADFSDDGVSFSGAYGPPVVEQLPYVLRSLVADRDTRQAWLTIWRPSPPPSRDIPCTIALGFMIRAGWLNVHAYMRSSDVWLGLPYDMFTFSMIGARVACEYNRTVPERPVALGHLFLTAASSHLYEMNAAAANNVLTHRIIGARDAIQSRSQPVPEDTIRLGHWDLIETALIACRDKSETEAFTDVAEHWRIRP